MVLTAVFGLCLAAVYLAAAAVLGKVRMVAALEYKLFDLELERMNRYAE